MEQPNYYEAVLFDLDGVIIDTNHSITTFWQRIAGLYSRKLTPQDLVQSVYGRTAMETLEDLFPHVDQQKKQNILEMLHEYELISAYIEVSGAVALLRALKRRKVPLALVTSAVNEKVEVVINQLNIERVFDVHITSNRIARGKPHPECYLLAAQSLDKDPARCIVFEDAVSGVKAAVAAGSLCIGVESMGMTPSLKLEGAHTTVTDLRAVDLLPWENGDTLLRLNSQSFFLRGT